MPALYPYPVLTSQPNLLVTKVTIDGTLPSGQAVDVETKTVGIVNLGLDGWRYCSLSVRVEAASEEVRHIEGEGQRLTMTLVASAVASETRQSVPLIRNDISAPMWSGRIDLERCNFSGKITLRAVATSTVGGIDHRFVGATEPWSVWMDEPATAILEGTLPVEWRDFKNSAERPAGLDPELQEEIFFADLSPSKPKVFLNKAVEGLTKLLDRPPADPAQRALHDTEMTGIAASVWLAMFSTALSSIEDPDEGEPAWPNEDWQERVLRLLLPRIYACGDDEALKKAVEERVKPGGSATLSSRAQAAISAQLKATKRLVHSIRALDSIAQEVEPS